MADNVNGIYTSFLGKMATNDIDWEISPMKCMLQLQSSTYTFNKNHVFRSDLSGFSELVTTGYTAGGMTIPVDANRVARVETTGTIRVELALGDISWASLAAGPIVHGYIIYVVVGSAGTDPLVCYVGNASGFPATLGGGQFLIDINVEGQIQLVN